MADIAENLAEAAAPTAGAQVPGDEPRERGWRRRTFELLALALLCGFIWTAQAYWVRAPSVVDENGYLVGGKLLARHGSPALVLRDAAGRPDPFQFVGATWTGVDVGRRHERYYPIYPLGLPALIALAYRAGGAAWGTTLAYCVSPACMVLALAGTFLLLRGFVGSYAAWLGTAVLAFSPAVLGLMDKANSHAAALCCVVWGMYELMRWWRGAALAHGIIAGALLGCAATIRYTEGLLVLPVLLVVLLAGQRRGRWMLLAAWALPPFALVAFNRIAMHSWTGYGPTGASTAFAWRYLFGDSVYAPNWESMLRQLDYGLFFVLPLAAVGWFVMLGRQWRLALVLAAWIAPNLAVYSAYYFAPDGGGTGYVRFFLTVFPALLLCALWGLRFAAQASSARWGEALAAGALGLVAAVTVAMSLQSFPVQLERVHRNRLMMDVGGREVAGAGPTAGHVPPGSVLIGRSSLLHHLQFIGDYYLYDAEMFSADGLRFGAMPDPEEPVLQRQQRAASLLRQLGGTFGQEQLTGTQRRILTEALGRGQRVFFVTSVTPGLTPEQAVDSLLPGGSRPALEREYQLKRVARWSFFEAPARPEPLRPPSRRRLPQVMPLDPSLRSWAMLELVKRPDGPRP